MGQGGGEKEENGGENKNFGKRREIMEKDT